MLKQYPIPEVVIQKLTDKVNSAITKYSESDYTTNAGAVLRFITKILPVNWLIKMYAHKISPQ